MNLFDILCQIVFDANFQLRTEVVREARNLFKLRTQTGARALANSSGGRRVAAADAARRSARARVYEPRRR